MHEDDGKKIPSTEPSEERPKGPKAVNEVTPVEVVNRKVSWMVLMSDSFS